MTLAPPDPRTLSMMIESGLQAAADNTGRALQKAEGTLGPSDMGFCRHKAALVTTQTAPSDTRTRLWSAIVGSGVHGYVEQLLGQVFPEWIIEGNPVTCLLPNGAEISGTPDVIAPEWNAIIDFKSKDGFEYVKREGMSQNNRFQGFCYADGACRAGLLDRSKPVYVVMVYLDRSGYESKPWIEMEEVNWGLADEISSWVDDVIYAVKQGNLEEAPRDVPASICQQICEFYTTCRGSLPAAESTLITDEHLLASVELLVEGRDMAKRGEAMRKAAAKELKGTNGSTGEWQVRTTFVPPSDVAASHRRAYEKVEVVPVTK